VLITEEDDAMQMYFGDVSLCYTYSLAMALHSYGYDVRPEFLEAIMVMGNGASIVKEDEKHPLVFFDNGMPDSSISHSLNILGFTYDEYYIKDSNEVNLLSIREKLSKFLLSGAVVLGPLDMGYLTYNPNHIHLYGVDHFVSVYDLDDEFIYFHDPAGFACMKIQFEDFLPAWQAQEIDYKRGAYSMWGNFKRVANPDASAIYLATSQIMAQRYLQGQEGVLSLYAAAVAKYGFNEKQKKTAETDQLLPVEVLEEADYAGWLSQLQSIPSLWRETEEPLLLIEEIRGAD